MSKLYTYENIKALVSLSVIREGEEKKVSIFCAIFMVFRSSALLHLDVWQVDAEGYEEHVSSIFRCQS
jgi:hypothetical protein